ncbi:hypothetical protein GCM10011515_19780 [Tsuneonella deserti]|uniref:Uncharacterized protein n=1 Tax=Tsuneonella deserti TaxID=2035528 RepID=A0ABQ1S963_9SPHN|nr:hypothetical protein [Tsuneonella deserti]GGE00026.1 hypothetical protein GCM10011515_19780 [Tsuneonella deserti]
MAGFLPSLLRLRVVASLLLAVVALQATPAQPLPVSPDKGPAFSASSAEVAVVARRAQLAEPRPQVQPDPLPPPPLALALAQPRLAHAARQIFQAPADPLHHLSLELRPASPATGPPAA